MSKSLYKYPRNGIYFLEQLGIYVGTCLQKNSFYVIFFSFSRQTLSMEISPLFSEKCLLSFFMKIFLICMQILYSQCILWCQNIIQGKCFLESPRISVNIFFLECSGTRIFLMVMEYGGIQQAKNGKPTFIEKTLSSIYLRGR